MIDIIKWVREIIPKWNKQKWDWADSIIEKSWQINNQIVKYANKQKKKLGRPKKEQNINSKQTFIENYFGMDLSN